MVGRVHFCFPGSKLVLDVEVMFRSFKRYLPSGLYGRVALILVLPVVLLWLVVSIVFIQRHFEGVTKQMSRAVISELSMLSKRLIADHGLTRTTENLAKTLNITIETVAADNARSQKRKNYNALSFG